MKLKELFMQVAYEDIEKAIETVFHNVEIKPNTRKKWKKVLDTLQGMKAEVNDMIIRVVPRDVSGYYDEEILKKYPEQKGFHSLVTTPWRYWLGMDVDEKTQKEMSVADILANCIYEMTYWGYDEATISKNLEDKFRPNQADEEYWEKRRKEDAERFDLYKKRAEQGDAFAQHWLGTHYHEGWDVAKDTTMAAFWWGKAAEQGVKISQLVLGRCYYKGEGVVKDFIQAVYWFHKAAEQGVVDAQYYLGVCYYSGSGVTKDLAQATYWYRKAADQGHRDAQFVMSCLYHYGEGVPKDGLQAMIWTKKAAEQGHIGALNNMGECYYTGEGVPKDYVQAAFWYQQAAELGNEDSQFSMGELYEKGWGVTKDLVQALNWYRKAAESGNEKAVVAYERLSGERFKLIEPDIEYSNPIVLQNATRDFVLSSSDIEVETGDDDIVLITSGNGTYSIESDNPEIATAKKYGDRLFINGNKEGHTIITVIDEKSGQRATIKVSVLVNELLEVEGPKAIDLGLPSGTMWASCNIGATKPEEDGWFYAWGETWDKWHFDDKTYLHSIGKDTDGDGFYDEDIVYKDLGDITGTDYDVAHVAWGGDWKMPTWEQIEELLDNCNYKRRTLNGVKGYQFVGTNGNSIFLPAAGSHQQNYIDDGGFYWSGSQSQSYKGAAYGLFFDSCNGGVSWKSFNRNRGFPIRPVTKSAKFALSSNTIEIEIGGEKDIRITSGNGTYTFKTDVPEIASAKIEENWLTISGDKEGVTSVSVTDEKSGQKATVMVHVIAKKVINTYEETCKSLEAVDLGLPSGTRWANMNVGATRPEEFGGHYAWGEVEVKDVYNDVTYKYSTGNDTDNDGWYEGNEEFQHFGDICGTEHDVAHVKWGNEWQIPTIDQFKELVTYCSNEWVKLNGANGRKFTGPNGKSIFLPAAGYRWKSDHKEIGEYGCYWSGTQIPNRENLAYFFDFGSEDPCSLVGEYSHLGHSIRPVATQ